MSGWAFAAAASSGGGSKRRVSGNSADSDLSWVAGSITARSLGRQSQLGCVGTLREVERRPGERADHNGCGAGKGAWQPAVSIKARRAPAAYADRGPIEPRPGPSGRRLSGQRSSGLGHVGNLIGDQPARLAVHVGSRLGSRSLDQAEDLACAFVTQ